MKAPICSQWQVLQDLLCGRTIMAALALLLPLLSADPAAAETRRAFLVGIQRYSDGYIPRLERTANDAKDLGKDLEQVGFDKKNIKVVVDLRNRDAFEKEFSAFLKTIQPGDQVIFFFSGHGFGVEAEQANYLLFADLKSPFNFVKAQLSNQERNNADVVRLKVPQYLDAYQKSEIPKGISAEEVERRIAERNPGSVIIILDACRSLIDNDADNQEIIARRGAASGSRLLNARTPPPHFLVLYSASFGEQAVENLGRADFGRNSLFTGILRSELQRPGQSLVALGERVRLMVRSIANRNGHQQEPEIFYDHDASADLESFLLVGSIGGERFHIAQDSCSGEDDDWKQVKDLQKRELYERHIRRFDLCPHGTAEEARRALAALALSSDDPVAVPAATGKPMDPCDRLAASPLDGARNEVPGVLTENLDPDLAIPACEKAVKENPRIVRFLFNLGRAYQKLAMRPGLGAVERTRALDSAHISYDDAAKRGYIAAFNDLAVIEELQKHYDRAIDLFRRGAEQGHALAMYNLALRYWYGVAVPRDVDQAAEWFAKSAEGGLVSAMVELGNSLRTGLGQPNANPNPRRAVEWLQRAADAGSVRAKYWLGYLYRYGGYRTRDETSRVKGDLGLALLWFGRAAEGGDGEAQVMLAQMMQDGTGLPNAQPEVAERYWRLAAHSGDITAQIELADRMRRGYLVVKTEFGEGEIVSLLRHAMSQGSAQAAFELAKIYRKGDRGEAKNPIEAMKLAYHAIDLAVLADPVASEANPYYEISAAHLLAEMARNGEAVDARGRPLLTPEEVDRLEHYYGAVDPVTKQVKIRPLQVPIFCDSDHAYYYKEKIWVWDWGRPEAPTEFQIRNLERRTDCAYNVELRETLIDIYDQSRKNKVAFADLVYQKIQTYAGQASPTPQTNDNGRRRGR